MLELFIIENYKSFRDEVALDLRAEQELEEFHDRLFDTRNKVDRQEILNSAVVYGANASGKSNLLEALKFMRDYVLNSHSAENLQKIYQDQKNLLLPFWFDDDSINTPTKFEVYFFNKKSGKTYNYGFTLKNRKVEEEWLYFRTTGSTRYKQVFNRTGLEVDFNNAYTTKKRQEIYKAGMQDEVLIISMGKMMGIALPRFVYNWFEKIEFLDFNNSVYEKNNKGFELPTELIETGELNENFLRFIQSFEPTIRRFDFEEVRNVSNNLESTERKYNIASVRVDENGHEYSLPFFLESEGIQKMASLYFELMSVLETGGILVIDNLGNDLHPMLLQNILQVFLNPELNSNNAQLIFSSYDTELMNANTFRQDEIWFTQKEDDNSTSLYSLYELTNGDNKGEDIQTSYLTGEYGALPKLHNLI